MRIHLNNRKELQKNNSSVFNSNNNNRSGIQSDHIRNMLSLQNSLGNRATGRLLESETNTISGQGQIQRKPISENNENKTGCECDCGSYALQIAWEYANKHITYPSWFGGKGTPKNLELFWWFCHHHKTSPGCSWTAIVVFEDVATKKKYTVFVQMINSKKIRVTEHTREYPSCEYDFECVYEDNANRLKITEKKCDDGIYIPPGL